MITEKNKKLMPLLGFAMNAIYPEMRKTAPSEDSNELWEAMTKLYFLKAESAVLRSKIESLSRYIENRTGKKYLEGY